MQKSFTLYAAVLFTASLSYAGAQTGWTAPTPEELHMTSFAAAPGASAIILSSDEVHDDDAHKDVKYLRIKVLNEAGKEYASVKVNYEAVVVTSELGLPYSSGYTVDITGRTIQPDGTVVPLTDVPKEELVRRDAKRAEFTKNAALPAVQVGSILEYRITERWDQDLFYHPLWQVQGRLYTVKAHFLWRPTKTEIFGNLSGSHSTFLNWSKNLPPGTDVKAEQLPTKSMQYELTVKDVPAFGGEKYEPPPISSRYHVFFSYTPYRTQADYWKYEAEEWSKQADEFMGSTPGLRQAAMSAIAGASTEEEKARKLYLLTNTFENTDYTRKRDKREERRETLTAADVVEKERGTSDQIAKTYVALARAAGLKAEAMLTVDRADLVLDPAWLSMRQQLTEVIAVVSLQGRDHYLDPGSRYCTFDHLAWNHTGASGIRQHWQDAKSQFSQTPVETPKYSHATRIADVKLQSGGGYTATLTLTYSGDPALRWRHVALAADESTLREDLRKELQHELRADDGVEVKSIEGLTDGEVPLKVTATVNGTLGSSAGSRMLVPAAFFEAGSAPVFTEEKRDQPVYFPYANTVEDAVRYTLPAGFVLESAPAAAQLHMGQVNSYVQQASRTQNTVTMRRLLVIGDFYFPAAQYGELRGFFNDFEKDDHGSVVLHSGAGAPAGMQ